MKKSSFSIIGGGIAGLTAQLPSTVQDMKSSFLKRQQKLERVYQTDFNC